MCTIFFWCLFERRAPLLDYTDLMSDRSAAEWAYRVLLALSGALLGLYVTATWWPSDRLRMNDSLTEGGSLLVSLAGLTFAAGCAVWAFTPARRD